MKEIKKEMEDEEEAKVLSERNRKVMALLEDYKDVAPAVKEAPLEVRLDCVSYTVLVDANAKVETVFNTSSLYPLYKWCKRVYRGEKRQPKEMHPKKVLNEISLLLEPGKSYLVLGAPGAGKTTLLHAIAGLLHARKEDKLEGSITYNGRELKVNKNVSTLRGEG